MKCIQHLMVAQTSQSCENCCVDKMLDGHKNKAARYFKPWHNTIWNRKIIHFPAVVWKLSHFLNMNVGPLTVASINWNMGFPQYFIPVQCDFKGHIRRFILFVINTEEFWYWMKNANNMRSKTLSSVSIHLEKSN